MYALVANVVTDHVLRHGAKVRIISAHESTMNTEVIGLSKGGRRVTKHIQWKRLTNIRVAFLPENYRKDTHLWWLVKEEAVLIAQELMELWTGLRVLHPDGRVLQEGITAGEAFSRKHGGKTKMCRWLSPIDSVEARIKAIGNECGRPRSYYNSAADYKETKHETT